MKSKLFLKPGGYFFGTFEGEIVTLLGSCVSLCAWHQDQKILMASHIVLPERPDNSLLKDTRYGDVVLQTFLADIYRHQTKVDEYRLALFGGSSTMYIENYEQSVGFKNVEYINSIINNCFKQKIMNLDTGGHFHRRLEINALQGEFKISYLKMG